MDKLFFSIITVCYNSEKTIKRTFESLLKQQFKNFEYIVIDGNSQDNTVLIIKEYEKKFKLAGIEMKWVSERDKGIYDAMNKGIKMAKGDIIGIINSDDIYLDNTLQIVDIIAKSNPDIDVYHGLCKFLSNGKITMIRGMSSSRLYKGMIEHPTCFVRKTAYNSIGTFNIKYKYVADYDLMLRMIKSNKRFYLIEEILAEFDENGSGNSKQSRIELLKLQAKYKLSSPKKLLIKYLSIIARN